MSSIMTDMQKISVALSETDLAIEPGQTAQIVITMNNRQEAPDRLLLEVEGLDVEWYAIPVPAVNVSSGGQTSERILFKLARSSASRAGYYPFLVRVQAMETGEIGVAQATLTVKPFNDLQLELNPKRGVATFFRPLNEFDLTLSNLGNDEETLDLYANDPDDECAYEFDTERLTLKPGQSENIALAMRPKSSSFVGGMRLYGFTVSARATDDSYVSASAHGQLEKRALISPLMGIFLILLALTGGIAYALWPRPAPAAILYKFNANVTRVSAGDKITLSWNVANAKKISLFQRVGNQDAVALNQQPTPGQEIGSLDVIPSPPQTTYSILITSEGHKDKQDAVTVFVAKLPDAPKPRITALKALPPIVHQGEPVTLQWEAKGADKYILDPGNIQMSNFVSSQTITPDADTKYTLRAFGKDEKAGTAEKSVSVSVVSRDACIAQILSFRATTDTVYIGDTVRLVWKTLYAKNVSLTSDKGIVPEITNGSNGVVAVAGPITEDTVFTLTAADSLGKTVSKPFKVSPKPRPLPPPAPPVVTPGDGTPTPAPGGAATPGTGT